MSFATKLLVLAVTLNAVLGQLVLKRAVTALGGSTALSNLPKFILDAARSPLVYSSLAIQALGYLLWMILITRVKLGVATASVGALFYFLMALSAWVVYGEGLTSWQWIGVAFITIGVIFISMVRT